MFLLHTNAMYKICSNTVYYLTIFFRSNMERQPEDNPFLALFEPLQVQAPISPPRPKQSTPPISRDLSNKESTKVLQRVNTLIEDIFAITINPYGFLGRHSNDPGNLFDSLLNNQLPCINTKIHIFASYCYSIISSFCPKTH